MGVFSQGGHIMVKNMKKTLFFIIFLLIGASMYSDEGDFSLSLGVLGVGFNSETGIDGGYYYGRPLSFAYYSETGLGIVASPFVFFSGIKENVFSCTFINASILYNFFKQKRGNLVLGPSAGVRAVGLNNPAFFEFRSGFVFSLRNIPFDGYYSNNSIFDSDVISIELGYKYNEADKHGFYSQISLDLIAALWCLGLGKEKDFETYKKNPEY